MQLVLEHRAARRLGRVSGEHELDVEAARRGGEVGALGAEHVGRVHQRLALAYAGGVVVAPAAHALALLGDVGELQLQRAGADARLDVGGREPVHELDHRRARGGVAGAQLVGRLVQPLHGPGELLAGLLDEHVVQDLGEQLGVAREGVRLGGRHGHGAASVARWRRL